MMMMVMMLMLMLMMIIIITVYIYHAPINALSAHIVHINPNMILI